MKKLLIYALLLVAFTYCSTSPEKKAIKLIKETTADYKETPTLTISGELIPIVDEDDNAVIGYYMMYDAKTTTSEFRHKATFDKDVTIITRDDLVLEEVVPEEVLNVDDLLVH